MNNDVWTSLSNSHLCTETVSSVIELVKLNISMLNGDFKKEHDLYCAVRKVGLTSSLKSDIS